MESYASTDLNGSLRDEGESSESLRLVIDGLPDEYDRNWKLDNL